MAAGDLILSRVVDDAPDFPCGPCACSHEAIGETVHVAISDLLLCAGCFGSPPDTNFSGTGINGSFDAIWDGVSRWVATVGTLTVRAYDTSGDPCTVETGSETFDAVLQMFCDHGVMQIQISAGPFFIFLGSGSPAHNTITFCATVPPQASTTGIITLSLP